jgi:hypothetical protein
MSTTWTLTDYFEPMDGDEENARTRVESGDEVRIALTRLAGFEPRIAILEGPAGQVLQIGIGGPWAGFARIERDTWSGIKRERVHIALPQAVSAPGQVEFLRWAQPCALGADVLFPVAEVVKLVSEFISSGSFPSWIGWRQC